MTSQRSIGHGRARTTVRAVAVAVVILAGGCATGDPGHVYKIYGGPIRPDAELATILLGDAFEARIGPRKVVPSDYSKVQLLPGTVQLDWQCLYGVSVMIEPSGFATGEGGGLVDLEAGHVYSLHCDRTTGPGYTTYQWMRDDTTGALVAGVKKP